MVYKSSKVHKLFAANLERLMTKAGLQPADLHHELKISYPNLHHYLHGNSLPKVALLPALAKLLRCKIDEFFYEGH